MIHYQEVKLNGQTYEVHLFAEAEPQVYVIKMRRGTDFNTGYLIAKPYRQRIKSAPRVKRLVKMAIAQGDNS